MNDAQKKMHLGAFSILYAANAGVDAEFLKAATMYAMNHGEDFSEVEEIRQLAIDYVMEKDLLQQKDLEHLVTQALDDISQKFYCHKVSIQKEKGIPPSVQVAIIAQELVLSAVIDQFAAKGLLFEPQIKQAEGDYDVIYGKVKLLTTDKNVPWKNEYQQKPNPAKEFMQEYPEAPEPLPESFYGGPPANPAKVELMGEFPKCDACGGKKYYQDHKFGKQLPCPACNKHGDVIWGISPVQASLSKEAALEAIAAYKKAHKLPPFDKDESPVILKTKAQIMVGQRLQQVMSQLGKLGYAGACDFHPLLGAYELTVCTGNVLHEAKHLEVIGDVFQGFLDLKATLQKSEVKGGEIIFHFTVREAPTVKSLLAQAKKIDETLAEMAVPKKDLVLDQRVNAIREHLSKNGYAAATNPKPDGTYRLIVYTKPPKGCTTKAELAAAVIDAQTAVDAMISGFPGVNWTSFADEVINDLASNEKLLKLHFTLSGKSITLDEDVALGVASAEYPPDAVACPACKIVGHKQEKCEICKGSGFVSGMGIPGTVKMLEGKGLGEPTSDSDVLTMSDMQKMLDSYQPQESDFPPVPGDKPVFEVKPGEKVYFSTQITTIKTDKDFVFTLKGSDGPADKTQELVKEIMAKGDDAMDDAFKKAVTESSFNDFQETVQGKFEKALNVYDEGPQQITTSDMEKAAQMLDAKNPNKIKFSFYPKSKQEQDLSEFVIEAPGHQPMIIGLDVAKEFADTTVMIKKNPDGKYELISSAKPLALPSKPVSPKKFSSSVPTEYKTNAFVKKGDPVYLMMPGWVTPIKKPAQSKVFGYAVKDCQAGAVINISHEKVESAMGLTVDEANAPSETGVRKIILETDECTKEGNLLKTFSKGPYRMNVYTDPAMLISFIELIDASSDYSIMKYEAMVKSTSRFQATKTLLEDGSTRYEICRCDENGKPWIPVQVFLKTAQEKIAEHNPKPATPEIQKTPDHVLKMSNGKEVLRITAEGNVVVNGDTFVDHGSSVQALSNFAVQFWAAIGQLNPARQEIDKMKAVVEYWQKASEKSVQENTILIARIREIEYDLRGKYDERAADQARVARFTNLAENVGEGNEPTENG